MDRAFQGKGRGGAVRKTRRVFFAGVVIALALVLSLGLAEGVLRVARPELGVLVENAFLENSSRIFATSRNTRQNVPHPDWKKEHTIHYNNLGLKQCREFVVPKPPGVTRIGFFGDSFTENVFMPTQYSFTEPLDFLLNRTGGRFEVLNFGTSGYGTDQEYLQYREEAKRLGLDVAVVMIYQNDLGDILSNRLYLLDAEGKVKRAEARRSSWAVRALKRLRLTYFILDAWKRVKEGGEGSQPSAPLDASTETATRESIEKAVLDELARPEKGKGRDLESRFGEMERKAMLLFAAVMNTWEDEARRDGVKMYAVFVPNNYPNQELMKWVVSAIKMESLDLLPDFLRESPDLKDLFFKNDRHWNEEGNKIAAVGLFKFLAEKLKIGHGGDDFIRKNLGLYYSSLARPYIPLTSRWLDSTQAGAAQKADIQARYLALVEESERDQGGFVARDAPAWRKVGLRDAYVANMREALVGLENGLPDYAAVFFQKALEEDPRSAMAHYALGAVLVNKGITKLGRSHLKEALRLDPGFEAAGAELRRLGQETAPAPAP